MSWTETEDVILDAMEHDREYATGELCNLTGYAFTDIVFVLDRMVKKERIQHLSYHRWKKVPEESSGNPD